MLFDRKVLVLLSRNVCPLSLCCLVHYASSQIFVNGCLALKMADGPKYGKQIDMSENQKDQAHYIVPKTG